MQCQDKLLLLCLLAGAVSVSGHGRKRTQLPLSDSILLNQRDEKPKASECRFGGKSYELEQTWNPDLGSPFGVMYCVHCECVPIHKKRRIVGRVRCKNIKTECPKPTCPDPILLPGRCCKVCPGQDDNPDLTITVDLDREEQEKNGRHYAAVLSGHGISSAATGRFYFRKKTLQYSFLIGEQLGWPDELNFLDRDENILEDFTVSKTSLQNQTDKLCGAWERLPRKYRRLLRSEELSISLSTKYGLIQGKIKKYYGLNSELFSGLFEGHYGAGTAIVSVSPGTGSIHANILFKGIAKEGAKNTKFMVKFHTADERLSVEESVILPSVSSGLSSVEVRTVFDEPELTALGKGDLLLSVWSASASSRRITATIVSRISCDIFDCVLKPGDRQQNDKAGIAYMYFTKDGGLKYNIKTEFSEEIIDLSIDNGKKSKRLLSVIENFNSVISNGWANGTVYLAAGHIDELFKENLFLNLATRSEPQAMRGRILTHLAGPPESSGDAVMLKSENTEITGLAWAFLDETCRLHYNIRLEGSDSLDNAEPSLELEDYPIHKSNNLKAMPLFPSTKRHLQDCRGAQCLGHADNLHKLMLARLDSGDAAFLMSNKGPDAFDIKGRLNGVNAPQACLPRYARNDLEIIPGYLRDLGEEIGDEELVENMKQKCAYEGTFFENGNRWEATHEKCQVCSCQRGKVKCDPMVCPPTNCTTPIIEEGACCPTCSSPPEDGRGCNFGGDSFFHPAGSRWHPYIPPFGFSRCAICTCKEETLTVDCYKEECPRLSSCLISEAIRPDPLSCCKVCPTPVSSLPRDKSPESLERESEDQYPVITGHNGQKLNDMGRERSGLDILASGGCAWKGNYHENGESWHPQVMPWGVMKCVTCSCKDGQTRCQKKHCPVLSCRHEVKVAGECCNRCAANRQEERQAMRRQAHTKEGRRKKQRREKLRRIRNHISQRRQKHGDSIF